MATIGQSRPIIAELHAKLSGNEKKGGPWKEGDDPVSHVLGDMAYKNEPGFLAGEQWGIRQKAHQIRNRNGLSQAVIADIPSTPEQERMVVATLRSDSLNEVNIVDKPTHRTSRAGQVWWKDLRGMSEADM
ncbi:hypothetical protein B0T20DRAFT_477522 [Sordaria brevicollis]|uniref:Uncharacterized protein n=1 Tax=Sordaria brevicollis TaxID=83679 RepID=A0AAE0UD40_SORBR|nr:hypothetical protein B0T20DRAFT_477522 [Sordaria brevicollis]